MNQKANTSSLGHPSSLKELQGFLQVLRVGNIASRISNRQPSSASGLKDRRRNARSIPEKPVPCKEEWQRLLPDGFAQEKYTLPICEVTWQSLVLRLRSKACTPDEDKSIDFETNFKGKVQETKGSLVSDVRAEYLRGTWLHSGSKMMTMF